MIQLLTDLVSVTVSAVILPILEFLGMVLGGLFTAVVAAAGAVWTWFSGLPVVSSVLGLPLIAGIREVLAIPIVHFANLVRKGFVWKRRGTKALRWWEDKGKDKFIHRSKGVRNMTKIDIYSGFLGAGKTTLIKKLVKEAYAGQKIMIIENEFGEIGIDGGFLQDAGVQVREMNSGCICCSLTGDFKTALKMALEEYSPDRIVIEPSGVGKLSEVAAAVMATGDERLELGGLTTIVDASKCKLYLKNFGEFFKDQVGSAHTIVLSRTGKLSAAKVEEAVALLKALNDKAQMITADWDELDGKDMLAIIDGRDALSEELEALIRAHVEEDAKWEAEDAEHEHDEDGEDECCCGHHHHHDHDDDDDHDEHEHHHHHHDHDDDDDEHEHHHHHDHDEHGEHEHHHHHHHHHHHDGEHDADEVFSSWGVTTAARFTTEQIEEALKALDDTWTYGFVLRAKGIVQDAEEGWIHFDYTPGEINVRKGPAAATGMLCVIGAQMKEDEVKSLFGVA